MMSLESDSCPGNVEGKQSLTNCFSGGAGGVPLLLLWPAFPELAVESEACVYPVILQERRKHAVLLVPFQ